MDCSCMEQADALRSHIKWLQTRLNLFEEFTLSGLALSDIRDFELHVFIDEYKEYPWLAGWVSRSITMLTSARRIKTRVHRVRLYPEPEPYFSYPSIVAPLISKLVQMDKQKSKRIAMIRLDGDDTLMPGYMSLVDEYVYTHEESNREEYLMGPILIDLPLGIQYQNETGEAWKCLWPQSNFTTLLLDRTTVTPELVPFGFAHDEIPNSIIRHVLATQSPMWIQGIHSSNEANGIFQWATKIARTKSVIELLEDKGLIA